jgi:2-oxoisovalerate dehydrogenase E1 component
MSTFNRAIAVDEQFLAFLRGEVTASEPEPDHSLDPSKLLELFESQVTSRILDLVAREMRSRGEGFYTISSSGHEGNVVLGDLVRATDPAFLHYRSGALMVQRSRQVEGVDAVRDTLLGVAAAAEDPVSGGRHKVWGSVKLMVPPQTSTIASHVPKAVGAALAIERGRHLGLEIPVPTDSIILCSFGDASLNHSTAQGAFNTAGWMSFQGLRLPLLFLCEDNGLGISVPTPSGWVQTSMQARAGIHYVAADGLDLPRAHAAAREAVEICRTRRIPVFLHMKVVRLLGHAGSDVETEYRSQRDIEEVERLDPLLRSAQRVIQAGVLDASGVLELYQAVRDRVRGIADEVARRERLVSVGDIIEPLAPHDPVAVRAEATRGRETWPPVAAPRTGRTRKRREPAARQRHLAAMINQGLREALTKYPEALLFGEDVARKGGVYHVTAGLWEEFGAARVFNTLLDEQSILGTAIGAGHMGLLPIPEIQYLAYVHNAEDQIRGEACSLQFFSRNQFQNPMVVRIASFAYQKGFGGHFHNDNSVAVLRDVPGLVMAAPARGDDAVKMLRTCLALARSCGRVVAFLEPIALYMTKDLHEPGDGLWLSDMPELDGETIDLGQGRVYEPADGGPGDVTIVSYANGLYRSLRAARLLAADGIAARVVDLRWLAPLPHDLVEREARATGRLLVVDECRRSGGLGEAVLAEVDLRTQGAVHTALVAGADTYIPLGPAMDLTLPSEEGILQAARELAGRPALSST